ncbi:sigma-70 family RNA polymerase sigma factor [Gilvimarinus sp. SDUM040013]|uniref:Sigma-70 family RNA polymerase sigma factor n=2 Tax=Gilvimarinus gilvus TaxID=3058038 RepID=A0ABU4RY80_9GAMM|nr:sigma-70 family RNA polymerase sigma factor [Gilvimarinus sp. SDUM040013]MDX6849137.1 sigma-70 family RNA polymerase sigma factor [Gilvimarinus sp. SDUM040013]
MKLLCATAEGDRRAFNELYRLTSGKMYAVCLQLLQRKDLAEEALQEAYVRVWHNACDYHSDKGSVVVWMVSIARYRALDILRSAAYRREGRESDLEQSDEHTPEDALFDQRDRVRIDECMDTLEDGQRQMIQLAYFRGLTHAELTEHTGSPLGTIKSWIRRGLQKLKRCLEP